MGNYPNRVEAEDQQLDGYQFATIEPWEAASGRGAAEIGGKLQVVRYNTSTMASPAAANYGSSISTKMTAYRHFSYLSAVN